MREGFALAAKLKAPRLHWFITEASGFDLTEISTLVNSAYRGDSARLGWTHEADLVGGQRTDPATLARDLAGPNQAVILALREREGGPIMASVFLERPPRFMEGRPEAENGYCYLGMLSVAPEAQDRGFGRALLARAEDVARSWGAARIVMTVIDSRSELIAYYVRRGYRRTGEVLPFPYDDPLFGEPKRPDLAFIVMEKRL